MSTNVRMRGHQTGGEPAYASSAPGSYHAFHLNSAPGRQPKGAHMENWLRVVVVNQERMPWLHAGVRGSVLSRTADACWYTYVMLHACTIKKCTMIYVCFCLHRPDKNCQTQPFWSCTLTRVCEFKS